MINTTLCYIEKDGKYLMLHRVKKKNDVNQDKYIGIGGKFENGETPLQCALRETREETGLEVLNYTYRGIVYFSCPPYPDEIMHLFTATEFEGELLECDEGDLMWLEKEKLKELPLWEGDHIFLGLLEEGAPFFELGLNYSGDKLVSAVLNGEKIR